MGTVVIHTYINQFFFTPFPSSLFFFIDVMFMLVIFTSLGYETFKSHFDCTQRGISVRAEDRGRCTSSPSSFEKGEIAI